MPNNLFPVKDSSDSDSVEAAEVKSCMDWSVFTDEDSVNLLREFLKEHADQLPEKRTRVIYRRRRGCLRLVHQGGGSTIGIISIPKRNGRNGA